MSLTVLVVSKLIFPGYFVTLARYAYVVEHMFIRSVLLRVFLILAL